MLYMPPPLPFLNPSSPRRLYDFQDTHDELMHSFHSRHILSPSKMGFMVSAHRLINTTLLTLVQAALWF